MKILWIVLACLTLGACGGDDSEPVPQGPFELSATVTGLRGSPVVLHSNNGDELTVDADGTVAFPTDVEPGAAYSITVSSQPEDPQQICSVTNGEGTVGNADISVEVLCATLITFDNSQTVAQTGNYVNEALLQLAEFSGLRLTYLSTHLAETVTEICSFPGVSTPGTVDYEFADRDDDGTLSMGDGVTLTLRDCDTPSLGRDPRSGTMEITIDPPPEPVDYAFGFTATLALSAFPTNVGDIDGTLAVSYTDLDEKRTLNATVVDSGITIPAGGLNYLGTIRVWSRRRRRWITSRPATRSTAPAPSIASC